MEDAVVIFSGGPDSTAAALWAIENNFSAELLTFQFKNKEQYGEIKSAISIASILDLPHTIFDFKSPMQHFKPNAHIMMHAGTVPGDINSSVAHRLPFGTGMMLATAANYAVYNSKNTLVWGATKDDMNSGAFEYSKEFCDSLAELISTASGERVKILMPFIGLHKYEIIKQYFTSRVDLFSLTWSCKVGGSVQSGNCSASIARRVAARIAGIEDKTIYSIDRIEWPLTQQQMISPEKIDDVQMAKISGSPKDKFPI